MIQKRTMLILFSDVLSIFPRQKFNQKLTYIFKNAYFSNELKFKKMKFPFNVLSRHLIEVINVLVFFNTSKKNTFKYFQQNVFAYFHQKYCLPIRILQAFKITYVYKRMFYKSF